MGLTVSNVHVDSSLLSDEVSDFRSPPYANSFVALTSCLLLQKFAKWFLLAHRLHCLPKAGHFLVPPWCGHCLPQLKHDFLFGFIWHLDFLTFTLPSRPYLLNVVPRSTGNTNSGTRELTLKCKFKCYINP